MSVVSAPNALLARCTAAPRAGVRAARSTSVVRCDASKGAESNNPRASLGRRDVFGAVAAGVALLSSSQPASALQPGDIGYLKAQREAAANAPPAAPAPAKKTAKAKPAPKPKAPPKPKPTPKAKAAPAPKAAPTPPPPAPPPTPPPPPAPAPTPPPAASKEGTKSSKQLTGVGFDVVAGVIATTLLLSTTSNKEYSADVSTKKAPTKPTGSGASDAKANAASAQVSLFLFSYGQLV
jgi:outer membrane biosynthesis protein TonB